MAEIACRAAWRASIAVRQPFEPDRLGRTRTSGRRFVAPAVGREVAAKDGESPVTTPVALTRTSPLKTITSPCTAPSTRTEPPETA